MPELHRQRAGLSKYPAIVATATEKILEREKRISAERLKAKKREETELGGHQLPGEQRHRRGWSEKGRREAAANLKFEEQQKLDTAQWHKDKERRRIAEETELGGPALLEQRRRPGHSAYGRTTTAAEEKHKQQESEKRRVAEKQEVEELGLPFNVAPTGPGARKKLISKPGRKVPTASARLAYELEQQQTSLEKAAEGKLSGKKRGRAGEEEGTGKEKKQRGEDEPLQFEGLDVDQEFVAKLTQISEQNAKFDATMADRKKRQKALLAQMDVGLAAGALQADQALAAERAKRGALQKDWNVAMGGSQQIIAEDVAHHNLLQQVRAEDISGQREQILHAHRVRRDMRAVQAAQIQEEGRQQLLRNEQHRRAEAIHRQQVQQAELQGKRLAEFQKVMAASRKREEDLLMHSQVKSATDSTFRSRRRRQRSRRQRRRQAKGYTTRRLSAHRPSAAAAGTRTSPPCASSAARSSRSCPAP